MMQNAEQKSLFDFRERLAEERQKLVLGEAQKGTIPAYGFIAHLADLDSAIAAIEAVIEESAQHSEPRAA